MPIFRKVVGKRRIPVQLTESEFNQLIIASGNKNEGPLFIKAFDFLKDLLKRVGVSLQDAVMSLDSAYDSAKNRKAIFNSGMIPNIKENKRNRKKPKRGPLGMGGFAKFDPIG